MLVILRTSVWVLFCRQVNNETTAARPGHCRCLATNAFHPAALSVVDIQYYYAVDMFYHTHVRAIQLTALRLFTLSVRRNAKPEESTHPDVKLRDAWGTN
jgi:hypothetical protein